MRNNTAFGGFVGLICVALFAEDDKGAGFSNGRAGLFRGGGTYLLKVQLFASLCISVWAAAITFVLLWVCMNTLKIVISSPQSKQIQLNP